MVTPTPITIQKLKLAEGYSVGTKIELYSDDTLRTGYNRLYVRLLDSATNTIVRDAHLEITPEMNMGSMKHSCPTEQTPLVQITGDIFPCAAIFTMEGNNVYKWSITIDFHNHISDKESEITFPVSVVSGTLPAKSFVAPDGNPMTIGMLPITKPIVGFNDIEFVVFTKSDEKFTTTDDLTMVITPEMPSMGHGSPNNVNPISKGLGHYVGKVNFSMTGEWKINLTLQRNGIVIGQQFYMITL
jgi:hypothetical protein